MARGSVILVPTRLAAGQLRRTLEHLRLTPPVPGEVAERDERHQVLVLPDLLTRDEWYESMRTALRPSAPPMLSEFEREVLFQKAAGEAIDAGAAPPFHLRPGLIVEVLAFYDALLRQDKTLDAFERLMVDALEPNAETDRGAERMLRQTRFLVAAFRAYRRNVEASGRLDEHALRRLLLTSDTPLLRRVVVTVGDRAADPAGLWKSDFDLLARLAGVEQIDVVTTEAALASGFHERIHQLLPEISEERIVSPGPPPAVRAPADADRVYTVSRDREEELSEIARDLKQSARDAHAPAAIDRTTIVFQRPLPYLYLARQVFGAAGVPYHAQDALPLAAEPFAAALDLVFTFVTARFTRASIVALLRSPHFRFSDNGTDIGPDDVAALSASLVQVRYLGERERLADLVRGWEADGPPRVRGRGGRPIAAARAALAAADAFALVDLAPASVQLAGLQRFLLDSQRPPDLQVFDERHAQARAAILQAIDALRVACVTHDDRVRRFVDLVGSLRRWIEAQTFSPRTGTAGVQLVDAQAARYCTADEVRLVGLIEGEWPERPRRNIFYPSWLLADLGWPKETDRLAASRAAFQDLLRLPTRWVALSSFSLENEAIVSPSSLLEEIDGAVPLVRRKPAPRGRIFPAEALMYEPLVHSVFGADPKAWLDQRQQRAPRDAAGFHGAAGTLAESTYAVSAVERYLDCPFKYFAAHVLRLEEETDDDGTLSPQDRGRFLHAVFHDFFDRWQRDGHGAVTPATLDEALRAFEASTERLLDTLPRADRAPERVRLLGSAAASGLGERVLRMEAERPTPVVERLLEYRIDGEIVLEIDPARRRVILRGTADRIDLLADGTLRLIDYKSGKAPKPARSIQLPMYAIAAGQRLEGYRGRTWTLGEVGYLAFGERQPFVALKGRRDQEDAVADGQQRFLDAVAGIERGEFPLDLWS